MKFDSTFKSLGRILRAALLVGTASVAGAALAQEVGAGQGVSDTEIVLGQVTDLSGPVASVGVPSRDGMIFAVEEINAAGGIHGRKLRLITEDSAMDPKKGVLVTQKLLVQDKVFAIIGTLGSAVTQATLPLALERSVPMLFPMAATNATYLPHHPLKFAMQPLSYEHMRVAVRFSHDKLAKRRFAIFYQDDEMGQSAVRAAEEQLKQHGLNLVERTSHKRGETNFSAQIARLKAANPDIVLLGLNPREMAAAEIEAKAQAWPVDMIVYTGTTTTVINLGGPAVEGLYGTTQFVNSAQELTPAYLALASRFKARFGHDIQDGANYGYTVVMMFAEGAKNAGRELTPLSFSRGLERLKNFRTPFDAPPVSYAPNDHAPPRDAMVLQVQGGKWKIVAGPVTAY
ncbi:MAG: ABC transporter substrate-binding protein [Sulfuricaulis sp.]|nr:ABC transporter substrate-binding protein [Sulfuricaulis sp.]